MINCDHSSSDMEACYARCNCWTDFPDMGGQVTLRSTLDKKRFQPREQNLRSTQIIWQKWIVVQITHEIDAWCFQDACWCSHNQVSMISLVSSLLGYHWDIIGIIIGISIGSLLVSMILSLAVGHVYVNYEKMLLIVCKYRESCVELSS